MVVRFLLCALGLVVLTVAADHLVRGTSRLAARLRIRPVIIGVVVIGLGTSAPEFLVSGTAAARGDRDIAIGNLVGSNILNLTLVLGLAALVARVVVASSVIRREVPLAVAAVAAFAVVARLGLATASGVVLALLLALALVLLLRWSVDAPADPVADEAREATATGPGHRLPVEVLRAVIGLAGVLLGAQLLVANSAAIAEDLGVPAFVIGFTLVALGTSLPELVTTIQAQRRGETDLVVGNLFGSNLFNSLGGGAVIGFADGGHPARAGTVEAVVMVATGLLAWGLLRRGRRLDRYDGVALLIAYAVTLPLLLRT